MGIDHLGVPKPTRSVAERGEFEEHLHISALRDNNASGLQIGVRKEKN